MSIKNTQELRDLLLEAIAKVEKGDMDHKTAASIIGLSGVVISSCQLDINYAKVAKLIGDVKSLPLAAGKK